ncbi:MAG: NosD domain-containing protein [Phycisphaerae bacterium]|jgi:hypothetical protein
MRSKKAFLLAIIALTLISSANADLILTFNGLDTTNECPDIKGKDNLVIAVTGDTEIDPNAYRIEAVGGVLEAKADSNTVGPQAYSFTFEGELTSGSVSLIVNNDMVIDGVSVKAGDTIYELVLFYFSETDTVTAFGFGMNLTSLNYVPPEPEPTPELNLQPEIQIGPASELQPALELNSESTADSINSPQAEVYSEPEQAAEPQPKAFSPPSKQWPQRIDKLKNFPGVSNSLSFENWNPDANSSTEPPSYRTELQDDLTEFYVEKSGAGANLIRVDDGTVITGIVTWDSDVYILGEVTVAPGAKLIAKGRIIWFSYFGCGHIVVEPGGCVEFVGNNFRPAAYEAGHPHDAIYPWAIQLKPGVSDSSEISYCRFFGAYRGVFNLDNKISIHDNIFESCDTGVGQYGPKLSDVINNYFINNIVAIGQHAYDINYAIVSNQTENSITNNTIVFSENGIVCFGVANPDDVGKLTIANNLIATCEHGMALVNGWMQPWVVTNAFYENTENFYEGQYEDTDFGGETNTILLIDDFNKYQPPASSDAIEKVWKDNDEYFDPLNCAFVYPMHDPHRGEESSWSMKYFFRNSIEPHYSEARADVNTAKPNGLGLDPNWLGKGANALSLWFYGQPGNDVNQQMYIQLTDGDTEDFYIIDNFNRIYGSFYPDRLRDTWNDYWTQSPETRAFVYPISPPAGPSRLGEPPRKSMKYEYDNDRSPYYSEAIATIGTEDGELDIGSNWFDLEAQALTLWFYGKQTNDANEQMYVTLKDGSGQAATVNYVNMDDIREEKWHQWNIPLEMPPFDEINMADINQIIIGFGDGTTRGTGIVYFEDIQLSKIYPPLPHTVKVLYNGNMNDIRYSVWRKWNIPLTDFNDMNLGNVKTITIGFGDGNHAANDGTVFFEDITLTDGNYISNDPYDEGSVQLFDDPFIFGVWGLLLEGYLPVIDQHCALIDGGYGYIDWYPELIGKTDSVDWTPDSGIVDIGAHYYEPLYMNAGQSNLKADFDNTGIVDFNDLGLFVDRWLGNYQEDYDLWFVDFYKYDLNNDGSIDFLDFAFFAQDWLQTGTSLLPNIVPTFDKDPNNLNSYVEMKYSGADPRTFASYVLIDGQFCGQFYLADGPGEYSTKRIATENFANGPHIIKIISVDYDLNIICSQANQVIFNNELSEVTIDNSYSLEKPFYLVATGSPSASYTVEVNDFLKGDVKVYEKTFAGDINAVIPPETFAADSQYYELKIKDSVGNVKFKEAFGMDIMAQMKKEKQKQ